ncbi:hypothetical protein [Gimesia aquarii]|nr:hypothetical protein [Gimesia aquarii]
MKPFDTSGMLENDDELESVLREYFQQEMPLELQELSDISDEEYEKQAKQVSKLGNEVPDSFGKKPRRQFKLSMLMTGVCACLIVAVVVFTRIRPVENIPVVNRPINVPTELSKTDHVSDNSHSVNSETLVVDHGNVPKEMTPDVNKSVHESIDITLYNTEFGPIEQKTELLWTNITFQNPETGTNVEMSMPELTIDFVPVSKARISLINDEGGNEQ